jgi:hypothetical protein
MVICENDGAADDMTAISTVSDNARVCIAQLGDG